MILTLSSTDTYSDASTTDTFKNIMGKGEIAHNERFLLFLQCFLLNQIIVSPFVHILYIIPLFGAKCEEPKICISDRGLRRGMLRETTPSSTAASQFE